MRVKLYFALLVTSFVWVFVETITIAQNKSSSTDEAKERFFKGKKLVDDGDYEKAIIEFNESYKIKPVRTVLYNVAACYELLHQYSAAIAYLKKYLKIAEGKISTEEKKKIESRINKLVSFTGNISILVNEPEANIFIDDKLIGKSQKLYINGKPVAHKTKISSKNANKSGQKITIFSNGKFIEYNPDVMNWVLDTGKHMVTVKKDGYKKAITEVNIISGKVTVVRVDLIPSSKLDNQVLTNLEKKKFAKAVVEDVMDSVIKQSFLNINFSDKEASITVNGKEWGEPPVERPIEPGNYEIIIKAEDYREWKKSVDIGLGERVLLDVTMTKKDTKKLKKKSKWWLWTIIGVVIGGGTAAAIAAGLWNREEVENGTLDTRFPE